VFDATALVVIVNEGDIVAPAGTVTEAGTVALGLLLESVTKAPPAGADPFILTVFPAVEPPPTTDVGAKVTPETRSGVTLRVAVLVTPLYDAEIVTVVVVETAVVVMRNVTLFAPAGTVTEAGTEVLGSLLASATTVPPEGAGPFSVTVFNPVIWLPPTTEVGESEMPVSASGCTVRVAVFVTPA
jgi:hypothetical protein